MGGNSLERKKYAAYPEYKDSGVDWFEKIPSHWLATKFKYEIDYLESPGILAHDFHEEGVPLLRIQNVKGAFVSNEFKTYLVPVRKPTKAANQQLLIMNNS